MVNMLWRRTRRLTIAPLAVGVMVLANSYATCASVPVTSHIRGDAKVWSCVGVTFNASRSMFYSHSPLYQQGATFSGTLMAIEIVSSKIVSDASKGQKRSGDPLAWKIGARINVFVPAAAEEVCPSSLPAELTVEARDQRCDTLPMHDQCLVPKYLQIVAIVAK